MCLFVWLFGCLAVCLLFVNLSICVFACLRLLIFLLLACLNVCLFDALCFFQGLCVLVY